MSADFVKLRSFVAAVDCGSMSRAAAALQIAQPALSQHVAALEAFFHNTLLTRSRSGVVPTEAGAVLYRHARLLLRQLEQARREVTQATGSLKGHVTVGFTTFSGTSSLSVPLLHAVKERHPDVVLTINDSFGHVLSELVALGRMDLALIYSLGTIKGVRLQPLFQEEFCLVAPCGIGLDGPADEPVPVAALAETRLLLPGGYHFLRRLIEVSFAHARITPQVTAELESINTLTAALQAGIGATILPRAIARSMEVSDKVVLRPLTRPVITATVSLCVSEHHPLSEAAMEVRDALLRCAASMMGADDVVRLADHKESL